MAWIESHQKLQTDYKLFAFAGEMGVTKREAIGILHLFWWWCVDHAEDGDLRRFNGPVLAVAVEMEPKDGAKLLKALIGAGFVDTTPFLRVHAWWRYIGRFMKQRYKDYPDKWQAIQAKWKDDAAGISKDGVTDTATDTLTPPFNQETNQPTNRHTNQPTPDGFDLFWSKYPNRVAKPAAVKAWKKILPLEAQALLIAVDKQKADREEKAARKEFVPNWPNPATWLNQRRWEDETTGTASPAIDAERQKALAQAEADAKEYFGD